MINSLLVTGDYWHRDFRQLLADCDSVTLMPLKRLVTIPPIDIDLVVIAQSRPDQFSVELIESLQRQYLGTPLVAILGSWCEGELRTGKPWPGVVRVYWHQWAGRYQNFLQQLASQGLTSLHQPATASTADRILHNDQRTKQAADHPRPLIPPPHAIQQFREKYAATSIQQHIGISAWTQPGYEMLADAVSHFGWRARWIERTTWDHKSSASVSIICVEADSMSAALDQRLRWLQSEFPAAAMVLVLNFPRHEDLQRAASMGISQLVSKPYELADIQLAIEHALSGQQAAATTAQTAKILG